ncbi:hypothetical protein ACSYAY_10055 [Leptospirillum ferriphilum]|uniref:Uncharacterized protein n=2 Tax=Leptospirillum TaxID=179 RepID=A0A094YIQ7_9BACT|nr:hypothetical protein [Leptospirillum ferriphilum]EDZ39220.1 MAG: Protein of unknown function [Leptospirillum sp. Group II '5-way CG']KGA93046.1 hypothetical protein LptCag_0906 [Leptospirillum ferriphilum]
MRRILERFFRLFHRRRKEDNGNGHPVLPPDDGDTSIDDKVLKTIANLGGPRRATHYRNGRSPRVFDKR